MAQSTSDITGNSVLAVRGTNVFISGIISAAVAGSIILAGNVHTDRSVNTAPMQKLGSGAYMTYTDSVCTNTGGLAKYTACSVSNPFSGTGVIARIQVDSNKAPNASSITCTNTQVGSTVATGANILIRYVATASGKTIFYAPSGSGSGVGSSPFVPPLILPGASIRCWHSTTPGTQLKEQLRVWMNEQYVP